MARAGSTEVVLIDGVGGRQVTFRPKRLILGGYTGRDQKQVRIHIDELTAQGIPAPEQVPELYPGLPDKIQIGGRLPSGKGWSSGEVEYVLFETSEGVYVGVGSDHTDRYVQRSSVVAAKQAFPKIVGERIWPMDYLISEWDSLTLKSTLIYRGERRHHQEASVATIIPPTELLALAREHGQSDGLVVFSGTVPTVSPAPKHGRCRFLGELIGPDGEALSSCNYEYEAGAVPDGEHRDV